MGKQKCSKVFEKKHIDRIKPLMDEYASIMSKIFNEAYSGEDKIFYTTNIVGEYAELLVCEKLKLKKEIASNPEYDATDSEGRRYQIKSRWMNGLGSGAGKDEFGAFKPHCDDGPIHYLVLVVFNGNTFEDAHIYSINIERDFKTILSLQNSNQLKPKIFGNERIDGSYKCYYRNSFKRLIELGLIKEEL